MKFANLYILVFCAIVSGCASQDSSNNKLPNSIINYTDDLGYGDLSCYNPASAYKTPVIDKRAQEGIRSTGRGGGAFEGPRGPSYLKPSTLTLGDMLKTKGYRTGVFGKWHVRLSWFDKQGKRLGGGFKNSLLIDYDKSTPLIDGPNKRGFDESFITPNCPNQVAHAPVLLPEKYLNKSGAGARGDFVVMLDSIVNDMMTLVKKYILQEEEPNASGQLYNLETDLGETSNLYFKNAAKQKQLKELLEELKPSGHSAPKNQQPVGIDNIQISSKY